jgi:hypothetical protein
MNPELIEAAVSGWPCRLAWTLQGMRDRKETLPDNETLAELGGVAFLVWCRRLEETEARERLEGK